MFGILQKRGQVWETLIPWIIAIVVIVISLVLYITLSGRGTGAIEFFKNLVRFR